VIGVDEKWVLVPKNNKPAGKRKRWMYVYLAVVSPSKVIPPCGFQ